MEVSYHTYKQREKLQLQLSKNLFQAILRHNASAYRNSHHPTTLEKVMKLAKIELAVPALLSDCTAHARTPRTAGTVAAVP